MILDVKSRTSQHYTPFLKTLDRRLEQKFRFVSRSLESLHKSLKIRQDSHSYGYPVGNDSL